MVAAGVVQCRAQEQMHEARERHRRAAAEKARKQQEQQQQQQQRTAATPIQQRAFRNERTLRAEVTRDASVVDKVSPSDCRPLHLMSRSRAISC